MENVNLVRWIRQQAQERLTDHEIEHLIGDLEDELYSREVLKEEAQMSKHQLNIDEAVRTVGNRRDAEKKKRTPEEQDEIQKENYERFEQDIVEEDEDINQDDNG